MSDEIQIMLRVIALSPPSDHYGGEVTHYGLQTKKGAIRAGLAGKDDSLIFSCPVNAKRDETDKGDALFSGEWVHGGGAERFLYLSYAIADRPGEWINRVKVMLTGIAWKLVEKAAVPGKVLEASIDGDKPPRAHFTKTWHVREN